MKLLLDKGADVNAKGEFGWTALTWAAQAGQLEVVRLLKDRGAEESLMAAACLGDLERVQRLIRKGR